MTSKVKLSAELRRLEPQKGANLRFRSPQSAYSARPCIRDHALRDVPVFPQLSLVFSKLRYSLLHDMTSTYVWCFTVFVVVLLFCSTAPSVGLFICAALLLWMVRLRWIINIKSAVHKHVIETLCSKSNWIVKFLNKRDSVCVGDSVNKRWAGGRHSYIACHWTRLGEGWNLIFSASV